MASVPPQRDDFVKVVCEKTQNLVAYAGPPAAFTVSIKHFVIYKYLVSL